MNLKYTRRCDCGKLFPSDIDDANNFSFIVPVQGERGYLQMCENMMGPKKEVNTRSSYIYGRRNYETTSELEKIVGKFS